MKPFLGAEAPEKQTPSPDDARSEAPGSDDPIPTGRALVATRPGGQALAVHLGLGSTDGTAGGRRLGRPETDLLDSGNPQLLSLIHISEPTRHAQISYAVFCLKKKKLLLK